MSLSPERKKGNKLRAKILKHDNYKCRNCSSDEELEVHHMLALHLGGTSKEDNLITYCAECHVFAPETGEEDNMRYIEERNRVVYEQLMKSKGVAQMVTVAFTELMKDRLDDYVEHGFISKEQARKIWMYQRSKLY